MITTSKDCGARRMARRAPSWAMGLLVHASLLVTTLCAPVGRRAPVVTWFRTWASRSS